MSAYSEAVTKRVAKEKADKLIEKMQIDWAWKLPRKLVSWAFVRVCAHATTGKFAGTDTNTLTVDEALRRWEEDNV